jgi:hypothetical protein
LIIKYFVLRTYADVLNSMNAELKEATADVKKLKNNFVDTSDIIQYLNVYNNQEQIKEVYFNFFSYCVRQNFDLDKEISI